MNRAKPSPIFVLAGIVLLGLSLTGCTAIDNVLHKEASESFSSEKQLADGWDNTAAWVPADSIDIRIQESTDGTVAVLRAATTAALDPAACAEVERKSIPVFEQTWTPADILADRAWVCGAWTVIPTTDGWFGWTPNDPDEKAQSPQP